MADALLLEGGDYLLLEAGGHLLLDVRETAPTPSICPSQDDVTLALLALLPRGRAWPANDGGGTYARFTTWLTGLAGRVPALSEWQPGFVQCGYFAAVGEVAAWVNAQFCALKLEFFCASASQTLDLWNAEYGLPDPCDPRADLCTRVAALAGASCAFLVELAERAGWSIACEDGIVGTGARCGCAFAGNAICAEGIGAGVVEIFVFLSASPAYQRIAGAPPLAGRLLAGRELNCLPDITPLQCLLARVVHAHLVLQFIIEG